MLQVVGGVDRIARAFAERLGNAIITGAEVTRLRRIEGGVRVEWRDRATVPRGAARRSRRWSPCRPRSSPRSTPTSPLRSAPR
jgi:hypothetical protein